MDDGTIMACSSSLDTNITKLQNAFQVVLEWLSANGLKVQNSKVNIMHFMKGPDGSSPALRLLGAQPITTPKHLHWLGFYLDRHLNFTHHTKVMATRVTATARATNILGNTVQGMSHVQLRQLSLYNNTNTNVWLPIVVEQQILQIEHSKITETAEHSSLHYLQSIPNDVNNSIASYLSHTSNGSRYRKTLLLIIDQIPQTTQKLSSTPTYKTIAKDNKPHTQGQQNTPEN